MAYVICNGKPVETVAWLLLECSSIHPNVDMGIVTVPEVYKQKRGRVSESAVDIRKSDWKAVGSEAGR